MARTLMRVSILLLATATLAVGPIEHSSRGATVSGTVIDAATGRPVPASVVNAVSTWGKRSTLSDELGRFALSSLSAGRVSVSAAKAGYVGGGYGQRFPRAVTQWIDLAQDEAVSGLSLRLWKYGVISGAVKESSDEPAAGIVVQTLRKAIIAGTSRLVPDASAKTDDRGLYRISRLVPGTYIVSLPAVDRQFPAVIGQGTAYPTIFFPQTLSANAAMQLSIESGEERSGIDFQRISQETKKLTATVSGSRPKEESIRVVLLREDSGVLLTDVEYASANLPPGQSSVTFSGVAIGSYVVHAFTLPSARSGPVWFARAPGDVLEMMRSGASKEAASGGLPPASLWAETRIVVDRDAEVQLNLTTAARVAGRLFFDGTSARPSAEKFAMTPVLVAPSDGSDFPIPLRSPNPDGSFETSGLPPGRYVLWLGPAWPPWVPTAVEIGGQLRESALIDVGLEDLHDVTIRLTDRPTMLTGIIRDIDGRIRTDASAFAFPSAVRLWSQSGSLPVMMQEARPNRHGSFEFQALPPGDYLVSAAVGQFPEQWRDPDFLRRLAVGAIHVRLGDGDHQARDLVALALR